MEGYYIYFDRENLTVSFSEGTCSSRILNGTHSSVTGYMQTSYSIESCMYNPSVNKGLPTYAIILIAVASFLLIILLISAIIKLAQKIKRKRLQLHADIVFDELMDDSFNTEY